MSISVGIYELFSYTIPGAILLGIVFQIYSYISPTKIQLDLDNLWIIILLVLSSFVIGIVINPITHSIWSRFFKPKNQEDSILDKIKANYPEVKIKFSGNQWPILYAKIKRDNMELANWIERLKAFSLMLQSIGFELLLFTIVELSQFISSGFLITHLVYASIFLILGFLALKQSLRFDNWFYLNIFEIAISYKLPLSKLVTKKKR